MAWEVESTSTVEDEVREALSARPIYNPPRRFRVGATRVSWFATEPGVAFIKTTGGSADDRVVAEAYAREWLRTVGYRQAQFTFYLNDLRKQAAWPDIEEKAKRLIDSGNVELLRNGAQNIVGHVIGDHGDYQTEIGRENPTDNTITQWQCECPWDQYAWQRTRQWKKYEGRPCAHVLATYWVSQSSPLDEEYDPSGIAGQNGQMNLFDQGTGQAPVPGAPQPGSIQGTPPAIAAPAQLSIPGVSTPAPGQAPPSPEVIPQQPQPAPPGVVSVPGARVPTPADPTQFPGGTFSSWQGFEKQAEFQNSDMVRLEEDEYGIMEGKSEDHGAGQYKLIPKGSIGEVLGQDPTTGWVDVAFAGPQAAAGPMEPYHVRAYLEPSKLTPMPHIQKPGPFIRRRT
jgi:hypothetical protein